MISNATLINKVQAPANFDHACSCFNWNRWIMGPTAVSQSLRWSHISVTFKSAPLLWTSAEQVVHNGPNMNAEMRKGWQNTRNQDDKSRMMHTQNRKMKNQRCAAICIIPAFKRWPLMEKELRADCCFFFSSRMQAFNRLVDHVTHRLPLLVELPKPDTEHAQSVQISCFFSLEQPFHCWEIAGLVELYCRNQEKDCVANPFLSLKRSLSPLSRTRLSNVRPWESSGSLDGLFKR